MVFSHESHTFCYFERKREIFVIRGLADDVRKCTNGKPVICWLSGIAHLYTAAKPPPSFLIPNFTLLPSSACAGGTAVSFLLSDG